MIVNNVITSLHEILDTETIRGTKIRRSIAVEYGHQAPSIESASHAVYMVGSHTQVAKVVGLRERSVLSVSRQGSGDQPLSWQ